MTGQLRYYGDLVAEMARRMSADQAALVEHILKSVIDQGQAQGFYLSLPTPENLPYPVPDLAEPSHFQVLVSVINPPPHNSFAFILDFMREAGNQGFELRPVFRDFRFPAAPEDGGPDRGKK